MEAGKVFDMQKARWGGDIKSIFCRKKLEIKLDFLADIWLFDMQKTRKEGGGYPVEFFWYAESCMVWGIKFWCPF